MPVATSPCLEVKHVAAAAGEALRQLPWARVVFPLNVQCPVSAGCATHEVKPQLSRGYWSALKGRFGIKWGTEVQELPEKEYCLRQRCSWVWLEERPFNNSDNLFSYLVMAYSLTSNDVLNHIRYSFYSHGWYLEEFKILFTQHFPQRVIAIKMATLIAIIKK